MRSLALDVYPLDDDSEWCAGAAEAMLLAPPGDAVRTVAGWLADEGWGVNRVVRHRAVTEAESEAGFEGALAASGHPQVKVTRVGNARWNLFGRPGVPRLPVSLTEFAAQVRDGRGRWIQSDQGVEAIRSPAGASVLPLWLAGGDPSASPCGLGSLVDVDLDSLLDNVLLELDVHGDMIGLCHGDAVEAVHPGKFRRRLLIEPDPYSWEAPTRAATPHH